MAKTGKFIGLIFVLLLSVSISTAAADRKSLAVVKSDRISSVLTRHMTKNVTIKLESGDQMSGIVEHVGDHLLHLSTLKGLEYYDAVVRLDLIESVVIRVKN